MERDAQRASIKRPITCPESTFDYLTVLSMPQVPLNYCKSLLFHGGDTGSIPVRDAKLEFPSEKFLQATES